MLYLLQPVQAGREMLRLQLVPNPLWNVVFTAFHVNPGGGHLSTYYTHHKIRLRFHWPGMFQYCKQMIARCSQCLRSKATHHPSRELIYSFPVDAPMRVVHVDIYEAGDTMSIDGAVALLLAKIFLQFGLPHTVVVDADSKFRGDFERCAKLLNLQLHPLTGGNNNGMIVERFNKFSIIHNAS